MRIQTIVHALLLLAVAQLLLALGILVEERDMTALARQVGFSCFCVLIAVNGAHSMRLHRSDLRQESAWIRWLVPISTPRTLVTLSVMMALLWAIPAYVSLVEGRDGFRTTINLLPCVLAVWSAVGYALAARRESRPR